MSSIPSLTSLAKSAGCAAKIAQADLVKALNHLPRSEDPNLIVDHAGSDDAAVYRLTAELALVETVDIFPPIGSLGSRSGYEPWNSGDPEYRDHFFLVLMSPGLKVSGGRKLLLCCGRNCSN